MQTLKTERYRLASSEIESVLLSHTDVQEVAVIGLPHEQKGNEIHAFVVLKKDILTDKNIENVLQEMINSNIGSVAVPKFIEFIDCLAKTSSGEVMRKALKAQALEKKLMLLN
jgi:acetyl-CoA synthetase